jgi:hypothetical protein
MTSHELTNNLETVIPSCKKLNIISAFVSKPAILWLEKLVDNSSICIVGRFSPKDFIEGASNIDAIKRCILSGYTVKCLPNLHAKIYQIDDDLIFTGSANMTGRGLALVDNGNLEACTQVSPSKESKAFIQMIINASINLTLEMIDKMQVFIDAIDSSSSNDVKNIWPDNIMPKITDIFVSDFPIVGPGEHHDIYKINPSLEFAAIEANRSNFSSAQALFKNSKAYCWLKDLLIKFDAYRDLGFGQISAHLHDILCDDPAPYRREIKDIQAHLYAYISLYASEEIEIYVPGRRSQVLRLIDNRERLQ